MSGTEGAGTPAPSTAAVLSRFSEPTRAWFTGAFEGPTPAQVGAWDAISSGRHALVIAPTGSGKTLSSFLWALDSFVREPADPEVSATRVLYISPLKALGVDVERNLRAPLIGITQTARTLGRAVPQVRVGVRSGDTPAAERRRLLQDPPDILITTPESLFLMLTSKGRSALAGVRTVIVDEVHAVAGTKRGAHLAVSLERLDALLERPVQRIGLSATVEPASEVARFLGGVQPVTIVRPASAKQWDLAVSVPIPDMTDLSAPSGAQDTGPGSSPAGAPGGADGGAAMGGSIWPHVEERIVDLVSERRSTLVFANSRRLAERLTGRLNEIWEARQEAAAAADLPDAVPGFREPAQAGDVVAGWLAQRDAAPATPRTPVHGPAQVAGQTGTGSGTVSDFARAHHGSVSKEQRAIVEEALKTGQIRCVVATSSLELGIDMGAVDQVIQVESPPSVASGLQRVGRAGHQVGEVSRGVFFPKHRGDLVDTAVVAERMVAGCIESLRVPANPLDILAQQTVAAVAIEDVEAEAWFDLVRRSAPFSALPHSAYESVLDLLAGRYPSDEFAELRPRILWDREEGTLSGRPGAQRLAVTSGGTIPDRGLFGVFLATDSSGAGGGRDGAAADGDTGESAAKSSAGSARSGGRRVGELDEEMVYESRVGDVILLGATSWRIVDITADRVLVLPAYGQPGKLPFWRGDAAGRPAELGDAVGRFRREVDADPQSAPARLEAAGLDPWARDNLLAYLKDQREATGTLPTEMTLVVERFTDELGDWRVVLHSPFGMAVHAPWALAVGARLAQRYGLETGSGAAMAADDGIVLRIPLMDTEPPGAELFEFTAEELDEIVTAEVGGSALFAARFRENAARALLLPRRNPGRRSPLWQQRQRAAQLLDVARKFPQFPVILETVREVLQDVYDLPALKDVAARLASRAIRMVEVTTTAPSPFAQSILFGYVAQFIYEGDSPLAERRAAALSLDPALLSELLGTEELRELLDADVIAGVEAELQRLAPDRRVRGAEGLADLLRLVGPLTVVEAARRTLPEVEAGAADPEPAAGETPASEPDSAAHEAAVAGMLDELVRANRAFRLRREGGEVYAAVEDAARLRDALGVPIPMGVPVTFLEPVEDPLGDLVGRYARTHGPFTAAEAGAALGLGGAVVLGVLQRLASERRVSTGAFRPDGAPGATGLDAEWCESEVLRRIRRRSLAALRAEVEPVEQAAYGRFLADWQHLRPRPGHPSPASLEGVDGVAVALDQLAGMPLPASAWESLVLPARVRDYAPTMLDELLSTGEYVWSGTAEAAGNDGWVAIHPADAVDLTLRLPEAQQGPAPADAALRERILAVLGSGGAWFFPQLVERVLALGAEQGAEPVRGPAVLEALWALVWEGKVGNDTFAPVRGLLSLGKTAHRTGRQSPRARTARTGGAGRGLGSRLAGVRGRGRYAGLAAGDGAAGSASAGIAPGVGGLSAAEQARAAGRWSLLPEAERDPTVRAHATAELLLDRYGVITRGSVVAEEVPGGFAGQYQLLTRMEDAGQVRRGHFVEGLGGAQFSTGAVVDRLRGFQRAQEEGGDDDGADGPGAIGGPPSGWVSPLGPPPGRPAVNPHARPEEPDPPALALAATDPANPYGAALDWPSVPPGPGGVVPTGHRPGRKAGAVVVLIRGRLVLYMERGGKTLLCFTEHAAELRAAAAALVWALRTGRTERLSLEKVNGAPILGTPLSGAMLDAGFYSSPSGIRYRS
ncbi:DEAD/DEAH box helicase [Micrococcus sp. EYE_162]|uniref:Lhr family helicase n=1 Tax=unclassified Micrococcus TaxID=2620948 RepID=UPI0020066B53|nr:MULTISPECIES: DEAD/DEAH box helicase [unclassified Micrococcus]MCK6096184.1 DEAD/DEAH box helicase [Micrococcus sp. EYE_212]MCK6172275.1 DEAD/DEAH box helicase [Micrococcus sp. EYE_162]